MAPIVHGLEETYEGEIEFYYLDIDNQATDGFKQYFGYRYQPEFYLIGPEGEVLNVWYGAVTPEAFMSAFDEAIAAQTGS
jgi:hypothetical protein